MVLSNPERRAQLIKGVLAGGMISVGFATGSSQFFELLVGTSVSVGGNLVANMIDRASNEWQRIWLGPDGALDTDIEQALKQAFNRAVRQLESDWKRHPQYHYLLRSGEHERARLSLDVLRELREDAEALFQDRGELASALHHEQFSRLSGEGEFVQAAAHQLMEQMLDEYLGIVEPLADFAKRQIADAWLIYFGEILRSRKGTPAWRACQQRWQASLSAATEQLQQALDETHIGIEGIREDIAEINQWLHEWSQHTRTPSETERDHTGEEALNEEVIKPGIESLQRRLADIRTDTQLILDLLNSRFVELDFDEVMSNFLQMELLNDQYVNLGQAGHDAESEDVSLANVFVDLATSTEYGADPSDEDGSLGTDQQGVIAEIVQAAEQPLDPKSLNMLVSQQREEGWLRPYEPRLGRYLLIGGPGQGKTTVSQFICQLFRAAILNKKPENVRYEKVHRALREIEDSCNQEKIDLPIVPRIPFRIALNHFAAELAPEGSPEVSSLLSYITNPMCGFSVGKELREA